ncbi:MAG: hypothetical protein ACREKG_12225 [Candidatus Rokuibacteriota bacterium]
MPTMKLPGLEYRGAKPPASPFGGAVTGYVTRLARAALTPRVAE